MCSRPLQNVKLGIFMTYSCSDGKKKKKKKQAQKRHVRTKLLFYSFFAVPVTVAVVFAKAPYYFLVHSGNSGKE